MKHGFFMNQCGVLSSEAAAFLIRSLVMESSLMPAVEEFIPPPFLAYEAATATCRSRCFTRRPYASSKPMYQSGMK